MVMKTLPWSACLILRHCLGMSSVPYGRNCLLPPNLCGHPVYAALSILLRASFLCAFYKGPYDSKRFGEDVLRLIVLTYVKSLISNNNLRTTCYRIQCAHGLSLNGHGNFRLESFLADTVSGSCRPKEDRFKRRTLFNLIKI